MDIETPVMPLTRFPTGLIKSVLIFCLVSTSHAAAAEELTYPKEKFPYCLNLRGKTFECKRDGLEANWRCEDRPTVPWTEVPLCLSWHETVSQACPIEGFGTKTWPYWINFEERLEYFDIVIDGRKESRWRAIPIDRSTSAVEPKVECPARLPLSRKPKGDFLPKDDVTGAGLDDPLMIPPTMTLHKNKFPACTRIRMQALECARQDVVDDWHCERRPVLAKPTALCLDWIDNVVYGLCDHKASYETYLRQRPLYASSRIDVRSRSSEPKLECNARIIESGGSLPLILDNPRIVPLNQD